MIRASTLVFFGFLVHASGNSVPSGFLNRPLAFEPNRGQAAPTVQFLARGNSRDYLLSASGVSVLGASMRFLGANAQPHVLAQEPLGERRNYFHGPASQTDIPTSRRVRYSGLYPGIDCVFYGDQKGLEFDFEVAPWADPGKIRLRWSGAKQVRLDANGELMIETISAELRQRKPTIFQERNGQRVLIAGGYVLAADGEIRFSLGRYDRNLPLIIDPVLFALEQGVILITAMAGDPAGNVYLTGTTFSSVLPTTVGAVQPSFGGGACPEIPVIGGQYTTACPDAFVIKLNPTGQLVYATYLGGDGSDGGNAIVADSSGNAYVAGFTSPSPTSSVNNFPITPNAAFPKPSSTGNDGFISKLNPAGNQLLYSTFIPNAAPAGIAVDPQGNVYLAGTTIPQLLPFPVTPGAFQTTSSTPDNTGVVAKLNADGSAFIYATYLGGSGAAGASGIAVDPKGNAYVVGSAQSADFPTTPGAFQTKIPSPTGGAFVTKIAPTGASLVYSTFLDGSGDVDDGFKAIRVDAQGDAIVLGITSLDDFPVTPGAFQPTGPSAPWEAPDNQNASGFLSKLNPTGSALVYSTYIAGGLALDVDNAGNAYVLGTATYGFPTTAGAYQPCSHGGLNDILAAEFGPDGKLIGATYLGGSGEDDATAIVALGGGSIYLAGFTDSSDFPGLVGLPNLQFVAKILINDPNQSSGPCLAYAIQNAATFVEEPVVGGEVVTLRGTKIGPQNAAFEQLGPDGKVSTELAGVQVLFDIYPAPLLYVQSQQINAVVPWEVALSPQSNNPTLVQVKYNGTSSNVSSIALALAAPGIFLTNYSMQQAAVLNADGTPNSLSNPAKRGTVIAFFGTGGGDTNPPGIDGGFWPMSPLAQLMQPVSVLMGGVNAEVQYAGSAPGRISGIFQINVLVPESLVPGQGIPIIVTIAGTSSPQDAAYLFVD
jgi:uncharacterized protein (TIGR03437 family)